MMKWTRLLVAGGILVLLTNAVVLVGAAYNRGGEPESSLRLTQRELQQDGWRADKDNSGITLSLNWRFEQEEISEYSAGRWGSPVWLDKAKLSQLGFDVGKLVQMPGYGQNRREWQRREALLVLELDGAAYRHHLQRLQEHAENRRKELAASPASAEVQRRAKSAEENYRRELDKDSRLFVIDAGQDLPTLRAAYPDRNRYAIVRGVVRPAVYGVRNESRVGGTIDDLYAERINVPFAFRQAFEGAPVYEATIAFGQRLEPWIMTVSKGAATKLPEDK